MYKKNVKKIIKNKKYMIEMWVIKKLKNKMCWII